MKRSRFRGKRPGALSREIIPRIAFFLMLAVLVTTCICSRLLAKYKQSHVVSDQARVAKIAPALVLEHEAVLSGGGYTLDMTSVVDGNVYTLVLPGTDIPKDSYVALDGNNETACSLYVEIFNSKPDEVTFSVGTSFLPTSEIAPQHGGTMYKYNQAIPPNSQQNVQYIIRNNMITVSDTFRDKSDPSKNEAPFYLNIYAYLVQID